MEVLKNKWFRGGLVFLFIVLVASFFVNSIAKNKIEGYLAEALPTNIIQSYDDLTISVLGGDIMVSNPKVSLIDTVSGHNKAVFELESLAIDNFSVFNFILNKEIDIHEVKVLKPYVKIYTAKNKQIDSLENKANNKFENVLSLDRFILEDAFIEIIDTSEPNDSLTMKVEGLNFIVNDVTIDSLSLKQPIPFNYEKVAMDSDSIYFNLGLYESLKANDFNFNGENLSLSNVQMQTKYSKVELSKIISKERDHFNIEIETVRANALLFERQDSTSVFNTGLIELNAPKIFIYRDKLVADDPSIKKMYGTMLRELPIDLKIDSLSLKDGMLEYSERVQPAGEAGKIELSEFNAQMSNISNVYDEPDKTNIVISTRLMNESQFNFNWEFDSNSESDNFKMHGNIGLLDASKLDAFTEPNLGVKLTGMLNKTEFYINGNRTKSDVDFKLDYDDFEVIVLQEDQKKKNKFFSSIANVFVKNSSKNKENHLVEKTNTVMRDQTKSVFNFLWLNVKEGLKNVMLGGGQNAKK